MKPIPKSTPKTPPAIAINGLLNITAKTKRAIIPINAGIPIADVNGKLSNIGLPPSF